MLCYSLFKYLYISLDAVYIENGIKNLASIISKYPEEVEFLLYNNMHPSGVKPNEKNFEHINFNSSKETVFLIHGWKTDCFSPMPQTIKDAYLETRDINVIVVDWKDLAESEYYLAKWCVRRVGKRISEFIQNMVDILGLNLDKTSMVGFSLGAHIAACASRLVGAKIDHITGKCLVSF